MHGTVTGALRYTIHGRSVLIPPGLPQLHISEGLSKRVIQLIYGALEEVRTIVQLEDRGRNIALLFQHRVGPLDRCLEVVDSSMILPEVLAARSNTNSIATRGGASRDPLRR